MVKEGNRRAERSSMSSSATFPACGRRCPPWALGRPPRAATPAGTTGQAVRSNSPSRFSGMKRVLEA
jgi:hypothetical protein